MSGRIVHAYLKSGRDEQPFEAQRCVRVPASVDPVDDFIFVDDGVVVTSTAAVAVVFRCVGEVVTRVVPMEAESDGTDSGLVVLVAIVSSRYRSGLDRVEPREEEEDDRRKCWPAISWAKGGEIGTIWRRRSSSSFPFPILSHLGHVCRIQVHLVIITSGAMGRMILLVVVQIVQLLFRFFGLELGPVCLTSAFWPSGLDLCPLRTKQTKSNDGEPPACDEEYASILGQKARENEKWFRRFPKLPGLVIICQDDRVERRRARRPTGVTAAKTTAISFESKRAGQATFPKHVKISPGVLENMSKQAVEARDNASLVLPSSTSF